MAGARRFTPRAWAEGAGPVSPPGRPARCRPIGQRQAPPRGHNPPQGRADHGRARASPLLRTTIPALQSLQSGDYRAAVKSLAGNPANAAPHGPLPVGNTPRIVFCNPSFSSYWGRAVGNRRRGLQSDPSGPAAGVSPGHRRGPLRPPADGVGRRLVQPLHGRHRRGLADYPRRAPAPGLASPFTGAGPVTAADSGCCAGNLALSRERVLNIDRRPGTSAVHRRGRVCPWWDAVCPPLALGEPGDYRWPASGGVCAGVRHVIHADTALSAQPSVRGRESAIPG